MKKKFFIKSLKYLPLALVAGYCIQTARLSIALNDVKDSFDHVCKTNPQNSSKLYQIVSDRDQFFRDNESFKGGSKWETSLYSIFSDNSSRRTLPIPYNPLSLFKKLDKTAIQKYSKK